MKEKTISYAEIQIINKLVPNKRSKTCLPASSFKFRPVARPTMMKGTMNSLDVMYRVSLNTRMESNRRHPSPCIHNPIENRDRGLTQSPSHPRVAPTHARPGTQVSDGQRKYLPTVERLRTNPMKMAHNTGLCNSPPPILSHKRLFDRCSACTSHHQLRRSSLPVHESSYTCMIVLMSFV